MTGRPLWIGTGRRLGRLLGEGSVFEIKGSPGLAAKVYAAKAVSAELHDKMRVMSRAPANLNILLEIDTI